jgi:serine/threonine protein kinase
VREVDAMKELCQNESHLNVIRLLDHGVLVDESVYFIDMELCDISLEQYINGAGAIMGFHRLQNWKKLEPDIFLITAIMQQLLSGLAFIHKSGKVHRDLNPKNGKPYPLLC